MKLDPKIEIGKFFLFRGKNFAPNLSNGEVTLEKSLEDKLLSPSSFIFFFEATNKPKIYFRVVYIKRDNSEVVGPWKSITNPNAGNVSVSP